MDEDTIITFGKYKGLKIGEVFILDSAYLVWALDNTNRFFTLHKNFKKAIRQRAKQEKLAKRLSRRDLDYYEWGEY